MGFYINVHSNWTHCADTLDWLIALSDERKASQLANYHYQHHHNGQWEQSVPRKVEFRAYLDDFGHLRTSYFDNRRTSRWIVRVWWARQLCVPLDCANIFLFWSRFTSARNNLYKTNGVACDGWLSTGWRTLRCAVCGNGWKWENVCNSVLCAHVTSDNLLVNYSRNPWSLCSSRAQNYID